MRVILMGVVVVLMRMTLAEVVIRVLLEGV